MDQTLHLRPDDRVLIIGLQVREGIESRARSCHLLLGIGGDDEVRAARREFAHLDNVMFAQGSRDEIPWADQQFTLILDRSAGEPTPEMRRVLAPGGRILRVF